MGNLGLSTARAVERLRKQAPTRSVIFHRHVELPEVDADAAQLEGAVWSLLQRAAHRSAPANPVEVWVRACSDSVVCEVADGGDAANLNHADAELGLARDLASKHGGTMRLAERWGGGAVVQFSLSKATAHTYVPVSNTFWLHDAPSTQPPAPTDRRNRS